MKRYGAPQVPLVQARLYGGQQKPTAIVYDLSMTSSAEGAALAVAKYHNASLQPARSHHYIMDEARVYKGVSDRLAAYHSPRHAISFLLCAEPKDHVGMWDEHPTMIQNAADLTAKLCLHHRIRPRFLDSEAKTHWERYRWRMNGGLIVRAPGAFPYETFEELLKASIRKLK